MHDRALFRRFPQLIGSIPWVRLATVPTPVQPLDLHPPSHSQSQSQSRSRSQSQSNWIKRDDLTGEPYGGNKIRKLEFLLAAAQARGARRLITVGAAGSHHALATAIHGRALGFDVTLVLFPQPLTPHVREILLLDRAYGAELRFTRRMETVPAALFAATMRYRSQRAFVIPAGGSDATGTLGYVDAGLELAEQIDRGEAPVPRSVVVAAGTLGTTAGLALAFAIAGLPTRIIAVRITSRLVTNERVLVRLIRSTEQMIRRAGADIDVAADAISRVELSHGHIGAGYGKETPEGARATVAFADKGIHLDPTYTAKAAAAFTNSIEAAARPMLFWQTLSSAEPLEMLDSVTEQDLPKSFQEYLASPAS